jgi:hypothetical protein
MPLTPPNAAGFQRPTNPQDPPTLQTLRMQMNMWNVLFIQEWAGIFIELFVAILIYRRE